MKNLVNLAYMNDVLNLKFCVKSKEMSQKEKRERENYKKHLWKMQRSGDRPLTCLFKRYI